MAVVVANRSNLSSSNDFPKVEHMGLGFALDPANQWAVVQADATTFVVNVFYADAPSFYPFRLTFQASATFTYTPGSPFPVGAVGRITVGTDAAPEFYVVIEQLAALGLNVADIMAQPDRVFAGDDVITGGDHWEGDRIDAGDGDDSVTGGNHDGWFDLGRGDGLLDGGAGVDTGAFDLSDRTAPVVYAHNAVEAVATVGGAGAVTVRNVEHVHVVGGSGYDLLAGGDGDDVLDLHLGGGEADGAGGGRDLVRMDFSDRTASVVYTHRFDAAQATVGGVGAAWVRNAERIVVLGGSGDDQLTGSWDDDRLSGGAGADRLAGDGGRDWLDGGLGDDVLDGGEADDTFVMSGGPGTVDLRISGPQDTGSGRDTLISIEHVEGSAGADTLIGNDATNRLNGGDGDDLLTGGAGDDVLFAGHGSDVLDGGEGNDRLEAGGRLMAGLLDPLAGNDWMSGGAGDDVINSGYGDDHLDGGDGSDMINDWGGNTVVSGGGGYDVIRTAWGDDWIDGGDGDDNINAGAGADTLIGGEGNDILTGDARGGDEPEGSNDDLLDGGAGDDSLGGGWGDDVLDGGVGNDILGGGSGDDVLHAGRGDDMVDGGVGGFDVADYGNAMAGVTATLYQRWDVLGHWASQDTGGGGVDTLLELEGIYGSAFDDVLSGWIDPTGFSDTQGWVFDEVLDGREGNDRLSGGNGKDRLIGGTGNDIVDGGEGDDQIEGGRGDDTLIGGTGFDTADYSSAASAVSVDLRIRIGQYTRGGGTDILVGIEGVIGTAGNDTIIGAATADDLRGGAGNDKLYGQGGDDVMDGGTGRDYLRGMAGVDVVHGGDDNDDVRGDEGDDVLFGDAGADRLEGGAGADVMDGGDGVDAASYRYSTQAVLLDFETGAHTGDAVGDQFVNIERFMLTDGFGDQFIGSAGNDRAEGMGGDDVLEGRGGADILLGGIGADTLYGGDGNDQLFGELGNDTLYGGAGRDQFIFKNSGNLGRDLVADFENGVDKIRFIGANVNELSDLTITSESHGWAVVTLPNGTQITLQGISVGQVDATDFLWS